MLTIDQLPDAHTQIATEDGGVSCLMFYFLPEGADWTAVCSEQGYEAKVVMMEDDDSDLWIRHGDGENVIAAWDPACPADGFTLASKHDHEDGPVSVWVRIRSATANPDLKDDGVGQ